MTSVEYGPDDIFNCVQCGECCKGFGGTYVTEADILAISDYVGMTAQTFRDEKCSPSGSRWVLGQNGEGYCVFVSGKLCGIHPVKPKMCRSWPFIPAVVTDPGNWRAMARSCPGMRTDLPDEVVREVVRRVLEDA